MDKILHKVVSMDSLNPADNELIVNFLPLLPRRSGRWIGSSVSKSAGRSIMSRNLSMRFGAIAALLLVGGGCGKPVKPKQEHPRVKRVLADRMDLSDDASRLEFLEYQDEAPYRSHTRMWNCSSVICARRANPA